MVWVAFTLLASAAVCYAVNQVLSPRPVDQTISVPLSPTINVPAEQPRAQAGRPHGTTRAPSAGDTPGYSGNANGGNQANGGQPATDKTSGTPTRRSTGDKPNVDDGTESFGNEPTATPTSDPPSPQSASQRQVDASHGTVIFAYTDGKMAVTDTQPDEGFSARVTKLQERTAEVKFTSPHTVQTVQAAVSEAGDWTIRVITVSS